MSDVKRTIHSIGELHPQPETFQRRQRQWRLLLTPSINLNTTSFMDVCTEE
jgi:hypothetical protein